MLRAFITFQVLAPLAVAVLSPRGPYDGAVLEGILGAQAALVGAWIALGVPRLTVRLLAALPAIAWFALVLLLRPNFNGWILIQLGFQLAITARILSYLKRSSGWRLTTETLDEEGLPGQFRIVHLLALMVVVPLVWGIFPLLEYISFLAHLIVYLFVLLVALGFALPPLIAFWGVFGQGDPRWRALGSIIGILLAATAMAYAAYAQTNSRTVSISWLLWSVTTAVFAALSFGWLKRIGFRIGRPGNSPADGE